MNRMKSNLDEAKQYVIEDLGWDDVDLVEIVTVNPHAHAFWFRAHDGRGGTHEFGVLVESGRIEGETDRSGFDSIPDGSADL